VRNSGKPAVEVAHRIEGATATLRVWVRQADRAAGRRHAGLTSEATVEVVRLRREVRTLRTPPSVPPSLRCTSKQALLPTSSTRPVLICPPIPGNATSDVGTLVGATNLHRAFKRLLEQAELPITLISLRSSMPVCQ